MTTASPASTSPPPSTIYRPLCLRAWEVRAILAGHKTSIRFPVERLNSTVLGYEGNTRAGRDLWKHLIWDDCAYTDPGFPDDFPGLLGPYRYGYLHVHACHPEDRKQEDMLVYRVRSLVKPGDRFWCKETWAHQIGHKDHTGRDPDAVIYRADGLFRFYDNFTSNPTGDTWEGGAAHAETEVSVLCDGWKGAATMPRWASRLELEIESVHAERLQDITEAEAIAEGSKIPGYGLRTLPSDPSQVQWTERHAFGRLWNERYGKPRPGNPDRSWAASPWVWCVKFLAHTAGSDRI